MGCRERATFLLGKNAAGKNDVAGQGEGCLVYCPYNFLHGSVLAAKKSKTKPKPAGKTRVRVSGKNGEPTLRRRI